MSITLGYTIYYVEDVAATLRYFTEAFALNQKLLTPDKQYGELDTGTTTLAFAATDFVDKFLGAGGGFTPIDPESPPAGVSITLLTDDVPGTLDTALGAGGVPYMEPVVKPWGQTVAYMRDPNGILIELATPIVA